VTQQFFWRRSLALNVSELSINNSALASAATLAPNMSSQFLSLGSNVGANYYNGQIAEAWTARTRVADIIYTRWKNYSAFFYGTPA
jgi:hypothetical protein